MGAYMYPITIKRAKQVVNYSETKEITTQSLYLQDLAFIGDDPFDATPNEVNGGYEITVYRTRLETDEEWDTRVAREKAYMAEYHKRHPKK